MLGGKPIVIAEFFACFDVPLGNNPDGALGDHDITVGITGVVDIADFIFESLAVDIVAIIEFKDTLIALMELVGGFFLGNSSTNVLNNPHPFFDMLRGEQSFPGNARRANPDTNFQGVGVLSLNPLYHALPGSLPASPDALCLRLGHIP